MLDALALEKEGVHTVTIVWDTFERAAKIAARIKGMPNISVVVIPACEGSATDDEHRARARDAILEIATQLIAR